ncbi:unnamed protein product [Diamesa hyperborea]
MTSVLDTLQYENPVLRSYIFWSCVLIVKMLLMMLLTGFKRIVTQHIIYYVYDINPEDLIFALDSKTEAKSGVEDVERTRRAHRNDLENILPFFTAGFFYVLINPSPIIAINLFRAAAISRIIHTFVYAVYVVPQPSRALSWLVCFLITGYMSVTAAVFFY